jgi:hypothetical protein
MSDPISPEDVLNLPMQSNDAGASTVGEYLVMIVAEVWKWNENFSGKRPFGSSGWHYDLYTPLVKAGLVEGTFNEDEYLEEADGRKADELIAQAIKVLWHPRS